VDLLPLTCANTDVFLELAKIKLPFVPHLPILLNATSLFAKLILENASLSHLTLDLALMETHALLMMDVPMESVSENQ
jgi:hypothetical protein